MQRQITLFIFVTFISAVLILGLSYMLMDKGLMGIGFGWMIGVSLTTVIYVWERFLSKPAQ